MNKDIVMVVDGISPRTKEISRNYITEDAEIIFADGEKAVIDKYIADAKILITSTKGVPGDMLAKATKCIYIQKYGAGVNNIAIADASKRNIPVGNVPGVNSRSVAEHALTLMLAVYKQIVRGHNALVNDGKWLKTVLRDDNYELSGKTVGLIGLGNIGKNLRQLLTGFGCRVVYYDAFRLKAEDEKALNVEYKELDDVLRTADIVSLHCPLTDETRHLINAESIEMMKPTAVLLNCARGGIVDEAALFDALSSGKLLGTGIDTYEKEPAGKDHPFCRLTNVVLSPHNGGGTVEAVDAVVKNAADNINAMLKSGTIIHKNHLVNLSEIKL